MAVGRPADGARDAGRWDRDQGSANLAEMTSPNLAQPQLTSADFPSTNPVEPPGPTSANLGRPRPSRPRGHQNLLIPSRSPSVRCFTGGISVAVNSSNYRSLLAVTRVFATDDAVVGERLRFIVLTYLYNYMGGQITCNKADHLPFTSGSYLQINQLALEVWVHWHWLEALRDQ
ncbi:hypothetical protein B0H19DRAFT_1079563 [Mycena capillaripes]|nr:hypothetical protein B0H19DRAFT_1079563 [Mycena capillaripes]